MPYTTPLARIPSLPNQEAPIAKPDGKPTSQFYTFLTQLISLLETYTAALVQVTPPEAMQSKTVATLPVASSNTGVSFMVTDANATTFNSIVAGGGANIVRVFSNGTTWRIG